MIRLSQVGAIRYSAGMSGRGVMRAIGQRERVGQTLKLERLEGRVGR